MINLRKFIFRKASRSLIDSWLVAHSVSQPPNVAGSVSVGYGSVPGVSVTSSGTTGTTMHGMGSTGELPTVMLSESVRLTMFHPNRKLLVYFGFTKGMSPKRR